MKLRAFVISLPTASGRIAQVNRIISQCPVDCCVLSATDGRRMTEIERSKFFVPNQLKPYYPFVMKPGELGCFLSHRKAWKRIVDDELDAGLIFEDDVELQMPLFSDILEFACNNLEKLDYIQFQVRDLFKPEFNNQQESGSQRIQLITPRVIPLRTTAQLVSHSAAQRLIQLTQVFDRPVDTFLQMYWHTGVRIKVANPSGVRDVSANLGGSTISTRKMSLWRRLTREVKRFSYRSQVKKLSQNFYQSQSNVGLSN